MSNKISDKLVNHLRNNLVEIAIIAVNEHAKSMQSGWVSKLDGVAKREGIDRAKLDRFNLDDQNIPEDARNDAAYVYAAVRLWQRAREQLVNDLRKLINEA